MFSSWILLGSSALASVGKKQIAHVAATNSSMRFRTRLLLEWYSQRDERPQPRDAQKESQPVQHTDENGAEKRLADFADAHMRGSCSAEVAGEQDGPEHGRLWDEVDN